MPLSYCGAGLKVTTYLHLAQKLRMSGAIRSYAFMACIGSTLPFIFIGLYVDTDDDCEA